ncbi:MAG TPA: Xaa-Pro peptidase family protein [Sumerlaeia bacterium]|nr:Xaa-Pro peptidase family protein [Sumerlaeia bacterium]
MKDQGSPSLGFDKRIARLAREAARARLDAFLVYTEANRLYFTGFQSSNGILVVEADGVGEADRVGRAGREPEFYTDFRYIEMARQSVASARVQLLGDLPRRFGPLAKRRKWRRVGYEGEISTIQHKSFREAMPEVEEWVEAQEAIVRLRAVKSRAEQAAVRRAVRIADEVYRQTIAEVRVGMTEWDIRCILRRWVDRLDAEGEAFDSIVSVGSNSSKPHAKVTRRVLRRGQPLLIDMGVRMGRYCSDMTRTVFAGEPSKKMRSIYKIVQAAQLKALEAVRAGRRCCDVDAAARKYIEKRGYGKFFGHGLGHGIGLSVHEPPALNAKTKDRLRSGMIVTIEPGIYLPGIGGVRIEDTVIVRPGGCEILTQTPKDLTVVEG